MANIAKISVLLVDNNPHMRKILHEMLTAFGVARVIEAESVSEAERIVKKVSFDLVILDFFLDRRDGADFTRDVRLDEDCLNRQVPILLLTALPNHSKVLKMRDCGVNLIVAKPVAPKTLFGHIHDLLDRPRAFIVCDSYVGPCRRRRQMEIPPALDRRRGKRAA